MTTIEPEFCEDCEEGGQGSGLPALPPPCVEPTCSTFALPLDETGGRLGIVVRTRGGTLERQLTATDDADDCGVIRSFVAADGACQGLDLDFYGQPSNLTAIDCVDPATGADLYINPIRRIQNVDGSCSVGGLPFPINDVVCEEIEGCDGYYPPPNSQTSEIWTNCGPSLCATIKNNGCYPMIVKPTLEILGSEIGGAAQIEYQPNEVSGEGFGTKFVTARGVYITCEETSNAGTGETTSSGGGETSSGGDPFHTHDVEGHVHKGPSHSHDVDCTVSGGGVFSGVIPFAPKTIEAGESYDFCVVGSARFLDTESESGGILNYGQVRLCLAGSSIVNTETVAALEKANS